jgi:uncharacterized protein (DUF2141 family)
MNSTHQFWINYGRKGFMTKNPRFNSSARNFLWSTVAACLVQAPMIVSAVCARENQLADSQIQVEITGLRNDQGKVLCSLYSSSEGFPKKAEKAIARGSSDISERRAVCQFTGLAPGTYAVSVFHDENSNGRLDTNFMGIPREGVGASNNARGHFGPPKFDAAAFPYRGGRLDLKINITYL